MAVLITCKNVEDPIENGGTRLFTALNSDFFSDAQYKFTPYSVVECGQNSNYFKLLWLFLLPARMTKIHSKIKALVWSQRFSHCNYMGLYGDFYRRSMAANPAVRGQIWPKFKLIQAFMVSLLTPKNEEDPIKNEGGRVFTTLNIDFPDAQGQLTP